MKNCLLLVLMLICIKVSAQTKVEKDTEYKAVSLKKDDAMFLALKDTAQKHIGEFVAAFAKSKESDDLRFVIKTDFVEGDTHEHMWSQVYAYKDGVFKTIFVDSPFNIKNVKANDKLTIKSADIEDWVILNANNETVAGAFSDRYLKSKE